MVAIRVYLLRIIYPSGASSIANLMEYCTSIAASVYIFKTPFSRGGAEVENRQHLIKNIHREILAFFVISPSYDYHTVTVHDGST